jgi:hypothetical protein
MASSSSSLKENDGMDLEKESKTRDDTTATNTPQLSGLLLNGLEKHQSPRAAESEKASFQVDWEENDPANPRNFSFWYKSWITFQLGMLALAASTASSIISPASDAISAHFNISSEVTVLNVSLYILGFAVGPLLWAPTSELWGRKWSIIPAM